LVRVCAVAARSTNGEVILVPGIAAVTHAILDRELGRAADWRRKSKQGKTVAIDPPQPVVRQILDMAGEWPFPSITGVIGCPTLRPNGSILSNEGYDRETGLVLFSTIKMPPIAPNPTRQDAEEALALLIELLSEFPFADRPSQAVALSMIMTSVLRGAMEVAPLHLVTAPEPGTGKSYLADLISMIATGERAAAFAVAPKPEETEKRLVGSAPAGYPVISLDNCRGVLEGDFLCQITERPLLQLRALGKSDTMRVSNAFTVLANGNNVGLADDLVRRTIRCALDADTEKPESRTFRKDPLATVRRDRGAYIAACLTIARAYIVAGTPNRLAPLPSYPGWSDLVRSPLVWLGQVDAVKTMETARIADPMRQVRVLVFEAWRDAIGVDQFSTSPEIVNLAMAQLNRSAGEQTLYSALIEIAEKRGAPGQIEPRRLGRWLTKNENRIASGLKLTVDRLDERRVRYCLRQVS